jgi:hypothetical protein
MPTVSIDAMNKHLAEISQCVSVSAIALLILDGAGWHSSPQLIVPDNIVLLPLPPYAPELNSTENIWEYLRWRRPATSMWASSLLHSGGHFVRLHRRCLLSCFKTKVRGIAA